MALMDRAQRPIIHPDSSYHHAYTTDSAAPEQGRPRKWFLLYAFLRCIYLQVMLCRYCDFCNIILVNIVLTIPVLSQSRLSCIYLTNPFFVLSMYTQEFNIYIQFYIHARNLRGKLGSKIVKRSHFLVLLELWAAYIKHFKKFMNQSLINTA